MGAVWLPFRLRLTSRAGTGTEGAGRKEMYGARHRIGRVRT